MDTELYQHLTHTYAPFTTKDRQSHPVAEIGTRPDLMTLPSGLELTIVSLVKG